jgi:hypothetical protein
MKKIAILISMKRATCQEASPFSVNMYIPCMAPAVAVVWHERDAKAYTMCLGCADHNVRNRGGVLLAVSEEGLPLTEGENKKGGK